MEPTPGQIYRHSKKGNLYKIICIAVHSETMEKMVVYETQYDNPVSKLWVRPLSMFTETVDIDGTTKPRFELIS